MSRQAVWIAVAFAIVIGAIGAFGSGARTAEASIPGDVCRMTAWDSNGDILLDGETVGGNGSVFLVFRVQDDPFGYINDFLLEGPVQDVIDTLQDEIDALQAIIDDPASTQNEIDEATAERDALQEVLDEYEDALNNFLDTDLVQIDSSTGSARITSKAEVTGFEFVSPNVSHLLVQPGQLSQRVDHFFPNFFNDADGHELNNISDWLVDVGVPSPGAFGNNVCGGSNVDGWGFVDIKCIEAGRFRINVIPQRGTTENTTGVIDLYCPGQADTAEISVQRSTVETHPASGNFATSIITVKVMDQSGARINGAQVTFSTDKCKFTNHLAGVAGDSGTSPAGANVAQVTTWSDTDSSSDIGFLADNPLENWAGTAELTLDCAGSTVTPGTAHVTAIVSRAGSDIVLKADVAVVGQASATGLTLTLTPDDIECGDTILATATAVDATGANVSNGTWIYFTTDTSSGVLGGIEGAQGSAQTIGGSASVLIATDPGNPGVHTVIAYTLNAAGTPNAQTSTTYTCDAAVAPAAPTVAPPATGTGSITPPNTGSAGLASTEGGEPRLLLPLLLAAIVATLFSGLGLTAIRAK